MRKIAFVLPMLALLVLAGCGVFPSGGGRPDSEEEARASENGRDEERESTEARGEPGAREVERDGERETVFAVNVTPAVEGEIKDYIEINGEIETVATIEVFPETNGELTELFVGVGDSVSRDQVVAEVDPSRPGQNFAASPVRSPIAGTVVSVPGRVGQTVSASTPVMRVSRTNELEVVTQVAERFISKIRRGLNAVVRLDAYPEERFAAGVSELSPVVDTATRTLEVKLRFDEPDPRIRAGMFAEVRIITEEKQGIVKIPADCLVTRFGDTTVFVVNDEGVAEQRDVTPGIEVDNTLEIVSGLEPGERVVYQGQSLLEDRARVRVIDTVTPLEAQDEME
ncbi:MAG: efflux RND transporter periplasmic adaptor subunit [Alkalispirochaetaceae bacterium]